MTGLDYGSLPLEFAGRLINLAIGFSWRYFPLKSIRFEEGYMIIYAVGIIAALIAGLSDLLGGWISQHPKFATKSARYFIGFAAGAVIAAAFFDILPQVNLVDRFNIYILAAGFFSFYLLERLIMIHSCGERECREHKLGGVAVLAMAADNLLDGVGIVLGFLISPALGIVLTIAVIIHEIPQGITSGIIMKSQKYSKKKIYTILLGVSFLYPIGAFLTQFIPDTLRITALAFIAGDFIYIGASDLLPEAHKKFNMNVILSVMLGVAFILGLLFLAPGV
jgi:zinc transporter ZupT